MTVIAYRDGILAADRQINCGDAKYPGSKIKRLADGTVIAWAGLCDAGRIMAEWYENGAFPDKFPLGDAHDEALSDLIVACPGKPVAVYCQGPYPNLVLHEFAAWGNGAIAAMAAMQCGKSAAEAVVITSMWCRGCGFGVDFFEIQRAGMSIQEFYDSTRDIYPKF